MKNGTKDDYLFLDKHEKDFAHKTSDRILEFMSNLTETLEGYQVSRLEHSLQAASRALRDKADEEMIVASLLHDIGDEIAPLNHSDISAAVLRPFVSEKTHWIVQKHGLFQSYYYNHHYGQDRNLRDKYISHPFFEATLNFCDTYDQNSFDPTYKTIKLEEFIPMVHRIFNRDPHKHVYLGL